ncbi:hypothetical protein HY572_04315 [Candidatus Micrarchaeota archaeon]|nr:hypothetical protein [Candidatus Micrarchaeota archaeon]
MSDASFSVASDGEKPSLPLIGLAVLVVLAGAVIFLSQNSTTPFRDLGSPAPPQAASVSGVVSSTESFSLSGAQVRVDSEVFVVGERMTEKVALESSSAWTGYFVEVIPKEFAASASKLDLNGYSDVQVLEDDPVIAVPIVLSPGSPVSLSKTGSSTNLRLLHFLVSDDALSSDASERKEQLRQIAAAFGALDFEQLLVFTGSDIEAFQGDVSGLLSDSSKTFPERVAALKGKVSAQTSSENVEAALKRSENKIYLELNPYAPSSTYRLPVVSTRGSVELTRNAFAPLLKVSGLDVPRLETNVGFSQSVETDPWLVEVAVDASRVETSGGKLVLDGEPLINALGSLDVQFTQELDVKQSIPFLVEFTQPPVADYLAFYVPAIYYGSTDVPFLMRNDASMDFQVSVCGQEQILSAETWQVLYVSPEKIDDCQITQGTETLVLGGKTGLTAMPVRVDLSKEDYSPDVKAALSGNGYLFHRYAVPLSESPSDYCSNRLCTCDAAVESTKNLVLRATELNRLYQATHASTLVLLDSTEAGCEYEFSEDGRLSLEPGLNVVQATFSESNAHDQPFTVVVSTEKIKGGFFGAD